MTWAPPYDFAPGPPFARSITGHTYDVVGRPVISRQFIQSLCQCICTKTQCGAL